MVIEKQLEVVNKLGLHARAAAKLVNTASSFTSDVWIGFNGQSVNAKSIMGLMMLAASQGSIVDLRIDGEDAALAEHAITQLFENRFDEDE
jgi:phosphocarrier protein HPr